MTQQLHKNDLSSIDCRPACQRMTMDDFNMISVGGEYMDTYFT